MFSCDVVSTKPKPLSPSRNHASLEQSATGEGELMETFDIQQDISALATTLVNDPRSLAVASVASPHNNNDPLLVQSSAAAAAATAVAPQCQLESTDLREGPNERQSSADEPPAAKLRGLFSLVGIDDSPAQCRDDEVTSRICDSK